MFIFCYLTADASIYLKNLLREANPGSYAVLCYNGGQTILMIKKKTEEYVLIEKIHYSLPFRAPCNWKDIVNSGKGKPKIHILRISAQELNTFLFDVTSGLLKKIHSTSPLIKILNLKFDLIPEEKLKRTNNGLGPIWHPKIISEDKDLQNSEMVAIETLWPKDGSLLEEKRIEIRLPNSTAAPFPIWISIGEQIKIRSLEIGTNMQTPYHYELNTQAND